MKKTQNEWGWGEIIKQEEEKATGTITVWFSLL